MTTNPYLSGNFAPVREELTAFDLPVTGTIPAELRGRLLRIGPNPVQDEAPASYHWFTGNGMVHGLQLRDGRAAWYRNRWVVDDQVSAARGLPITPGPRHGILGTGLANTNVLVHAGRTLAIVEGGGLPVELSYELDTLSGHDFRGTLPAGFTAHPKRDPDTGELHSIVYSFEWEHVQHVVVGVDGRVRRTVDVPLGGKPMVHDCAITERYVVILDLPVTFDPGLIEAGHRLPYGWNPDRPARVGLLPREGRAEDVHWFEVEPCFVFHPLNAYELADGRVVLDVIRHAKMFATDSQGPNEGPPTLDRWTLDPSSGKVHEERLDDRGQEFPRHDERRIGKPFRYGYTAQFESELAFGALFKHDLVGRTSEMRDEGPGRCFLEPVFVPRSPEAAEDDGWILAYLYDKATNGTTLSILHAQELHRRSDRHRDAAAANPVRVPRQLGARRGIEATGSRPCHQGAQQPTAAVRIAIRAVNLDSRQRPRSASRASPSASRAVRKPDCTTPTTPPPGRVQWPARNRPGSGVSLSSRPGPTCDGVTSNPYIAPPCCACTAPSCEAWRPPRNAAPRRDLEAGVRPVGAGRPRALAWCPSDRAECSLRCDQLVNTSRCSPRGASVGSTSVGAVIETHSGCPYAFRTWADS